MDPADRAGPGLAPETEAEPGPAPDRPFVRIAASAIGGALVGSGAWGFGVAALGWALLLARRGGRGALFSGICVAALAAGRAAAGSDPDPSLGARWHPRTRRGESVVGELRAGGRAIPAALPLGGARPGELVRVIPPAEPRRPAVGPFRAPDPLPLEPRPDEVVRLAPSRDPPGPLTRWRARVDRLVDERIAPRRRAFVRALLFGRADELGWSTRDLFVRTGSRHLLAVSGLHVVLVGALVAAPLARLVALVAAGRPHPGLEALAKGLGLVLYAPLAGGGAPVTRAACALSLAFVATPLAGRRADGRSLLAFAALVELALDPRAPLDAGVQLSYAATTALVTLHARVRGFLVRAFEPAIPAPTDRLGRARPRRRALALALVRWSAGGWAAALVASGATLGIVWARFGEWSPLEIVVAPITVVLLTAWLAVAWAELAGWPLPAGWLDLPGDALLGLLHVVDRAPATPLLLPERPDAVLGAVAVLAALAVARPTGARVRLAAAALAAVVLPWRATAATLELVALDVGHGTAVLFRLPGEPPWVFDAGSRDRARLARGALADTLRRWDGGAPVVCLSHEDRDHHSAVEWIRERLAPRRFVGARPPGTPVPRTDLTSGRVELRTRAPARIALLRGLPVAGNEGSRTLSLETPAGWVHLSGDAEGDGLALVLDRGHLCGPARLLLFPHHGSLGPHVGELLSRTRPREIWISSAERPAIAPELDRRGLSWRSTATDGPLVLAAAPP